MTTSDELYISNSQNLSRCVGNSLQKNIAGPSHTPIIISRKIIFMKNHYKVHGKARLPGVYLWGASEERDGWI